jgi:dimethylhistidine N-methyltransferase
MRSVEEGRGVRAPGRHGPRLSRVTAPGTEPERARFERDVVKGLSQSPKSLPSVYFYDRRGSDLFQRIMDLPEYYLTRAERDVLERHGPAIVSPFRGRSCDVVDLGAGDGAKSRVLLRRFGEVARDVRYRPVDVSERALESVLDACDHELPDLDAEGIVAEYEEGIRWLAERDADRRRLVLLLGSNIGNLSDEAARGFFGRLRVALRDGDHVLVGFDLVKDVSTLLSAYDDAAGVTTEFNLNLLRRVNRELGADFDVSAFRHHATFSPRSSSMESYLLSVRRQTVRVVGRTFEFEAWEPIHTEISRKYRERDVAAFARDAGFVEVGRFFDEEHFFMDALWRAGPA